jgi:CubicO group peptidase (beta-lactamase class C family)
VTGCDRVALGHFPEQCPTPGYAQRCPEVRLWEVPPSAFWSRQSGRAPQYRIKRDVQFFTTLIRTLLFTNATVGADLSVIDRYIEMEMELNNVPGAAIAVWHKGEIKYAKGFGVRSTATKEAMTADTPVDLASVSKSLTAVAVNQLSRQGKIDLEAPVTKYIPELGSEFTRIRIRHLITHTSGLTRRDDYRVPCCGTAGEYDLEVAAVKLAAAKPSRMSPVEFVYANSNYVLLAAVVQRVSGQSFPVFMREFVFRPLRMFLTTLYPAEARGWGLADPHERGLEGVQPIRSPFLGWYGSSLVKSTARDMAGYLGWVLITGTRRNSAPYDSGWFIRRRTEWPGSPTVLEHGGDTLGGNTAAIVVPAWNMAAVVLLNLSAHRAAEIARGVLARAAGFSGPPPRKGSLK